MDGWDLKVEKIWLKKLFIFFSYLYIDLHITYREKPLMLHKKSNIMSFLTEIQLPGMATGYSGSLWTQHSHVAEFAIAIHKPHGIHSVKVTEQSNSHELYVWAGKVTRTENTAASQISTQEKTTWTNNIPEEWDGLYTWCKAAHSAEQ